MISISDKYRLGYSSMFGVFVDHYRHSCMFKAKTSVQSNSCWATCPIFVKMNDQLLHFVPIIFFLPTWAVLNPLSVDYCMGWYYPLYILDDHNPWEIRSKATIFERDDNLRNLCFRATSQVFRGVQWLQPYAFELVSWLSENGVPPFHEFSHVFQWNNCHSVCVCVCAPFSDTFYIFFFGKCWRVSHFGWRVFSHFLGPYIPTTRPIPLGQFQILWKSA